MSEGQFLADSKTLDAAERCLLRISEAAIKLGDLGGRLAPDQPWAGIRGIGNRLRHDYDTIDRIEIWRIITGDLASLRTACTAAIAQLRLGGGVD